MINYFYEIDIDPFNEVQMSEWIHKVIVSESKTEGEINFIFCDDDYLLGINQKFLSHDTYTDIISFDNCLGNELNGDIFISYQRVKENADIFNVVFEVELRRVVAHGILHFCGYKDKEELDVKKMREKEDEKLAMFHVEH